MFSRAPPDGQAQMGEAGGFENIEKNMFFLPQWAHIFFSAFLGKASGLAHLRLPIGGARFSQRPVRLGKGATMSMGLPTG